MWAVVLSSGRLIPTSASHDVKKDPAIADEPDHEQGSDEDLNAPNKSNDSYMSKKLSQDSQKPNIVDESDMEDHEIHLESE